MGEQQSFQIENGGSIPTSPLQFFVCPIGHLRCSEFVETWHYSRRMPTGKNINFGAFIDEILYAVIVLGIGVNPYQAKFLGVENTMEIKRLCRIEPKSDKYPLSKLISVAIKMARKAYKFDAVVAFADPEQSHHGGIYKASGFEFKGTTNAEWHTVDRGGNKRHRRYAFRYARRVNITVEEARNALGLKRIKTEPKNRWVRYLILHYRENK